jgi:hypothetical protein
MIELAWPAYPAREAIAEIFSAASAGVNFALLSPFLWSARHGATKERSLDLLDSSWISLFSLVRT